MSEDVAQYMVPAWDCPACGEVCAGFGQDDLSGPQTCEVCGCDVEVVDP